jgi:hypothetical protein
MVRSPSTIQQNLLRPPFKCRRRNEAESHLHPPYRKDTAVTLRERLLDAMLDGELGRGLVITRQELIQHFPDVPESTTGVFLSNSEITTGATHSPNYTPFTQRLSEGTYRVHPSALAERLNQRGG